MLRINQARTGPVRLLSAIGKGCVRCGGFADTDCVGVKETRQHEIDFIVNRGNDKIYIQAALTLDTKEKAEQEKLSLKRSGDFFRKVIVTGGYSQPLADDDGIVHVGVIPFLLDRCVLSELMKG